MIPGVIAPPPWLSHQVRSQRGGTSENAGRDLHGHSLRVGFLMRVSPSKGGLR